MKKLFIFAFVVVFIVAAAGCAVGNRLAASENSAVSAVSDDSAMLRNRK